MMEPRFGEYRDYIAEPEVRAAFDLLVREADALVGFTFGPKPHGYMDKAFHYSKDDKSPYAFSIARKWLLFYIRLPALQGSQFDPAVLRTNFRDVKALKSGEFNFRLYSLNDAEKVMRVVFGKYSKKKAARLDA